MPFVPSLFKSLALCPGYLVLAHEQAATPAALDRTGLNDARPGIAAVLDAYIVTLPRVVVLVAASTDAD